MNRLSIVTFVVLLLVLAACGGSSITEQPDATTAPNVISFTATPATIEAGQSSTLNWQTENATLVQLADSNGKTETITTLSKVVNPTQTTTYRLIASNSTTSAYKDLVVTVQDSNGTPVPPIAPDPPTTPTPPNPGPEPSGKLEIVDTIGYSDNYASYVMGTIKNGTTRNYEFVKIVVSLYDGDDNFIGSEFTYSDLNIIQPGESSPFKMFVSDFPNFETYRLQVQARPTTEKPYRLDIKSLSIIGGSYPKITGQVTNNNNTELEFVKIMFSCYRNDEFVGVDFTYSDIDTLPSGQTSPFTAYLSSMYKAPKKCDVIAQGQNY